LDLLKILLNTYLWDWSSSWACIRKSRPSEQIWEAAYGCWTHLWAEAAGLWRYSSPPHMDPDREQMVHLQFFHENLIEVIY
jgi:hypothetical protein